MASSIAAKNLLAENPIIVNEDMEVIDGQHRLEAAKASGLPIYYIVAHGATIKEVQKLNANQRMWSLYDYTNSYAALGNKEYKVLQEFCHDWSLPVTTAIRLLSGTNPRNSNMRDFKDGFFAVTNQSVAEEIAELILKISKFSDYNLERNKPFHETIIKLHEKIKPDWAFMMEQLERSHARIPRYATLKEYLLYLEKIYNFNKKVMVRFM